MEETIYVNEKIGSVSSKIILPEEAKILVILSHGAGAGMNHSFMEGIAHALAFYNVVILRFNFPFAEHKRKRPDFPVVAVTVIDAVTQYARAHFPNLILIGAGKSFGGRMFSHYMAKHQPDDIQGIIFYGFPLHPPGKEDIARAEHLSQIKIPMLFLQGTNDKLAVIHFLTKVLSSLPTARLHTFDKIDHAFKKKGKEIVEELAVASSEWLNQLFSE